MLWFAQGCTEPRTAAELYEAFDREPSFISAAIVHEIREGQNGLRPGERAYIRLPADKYDDPVHAGPVTSETLGGALDAHWARPENCALCVIASVATFDELLRMRDLSARIEALVEAGTAADWDLLLHDPDLACFRDLRRGLGIMHLAAEAGRADLLDFLRKRGVSIEEPDAFGRPPLALALQGDFSAARPAGSRADAARTLLTAGADTGWRLYGATPLLIAVRWCPELVPDLIAVRPQSVNEGDNRGEAPLHAAVQHRAIDAMVALLEAGADLEARAGGRTPLGWACLQDDPIMVDVLLAHGARQDAVLADAFLRTHISRYAVEPIRRSMGVAPDTAN